MENGTASDALPLPVRNVTVNQIIAWNLNWYRRQVGLTQAGLGERIGWTNTAVSEAERSWDGKRTREFDADTIVMLAAALGVPVLALFLPPLDDGGEERYSFTLQDGQGGIDLDMDDLMAMVMPDSHEDTPVMAKYRTRLTFDVERYMGAGWMGEVARWLRPLTPDEVRAAWVRRLEAFLYTLGDTAGDIREMLKELRGGPETGDGQ